MTSHYKGRGVGGSHLEVVNGVYTIKPNALDIVWGEDRRYWRVNRVDGPAELIQVCWLEVMGSFPASRLSPGKYVLQFDVKMRPDAFGWSGCPVRIIIKPGYQKRPVVKVADLGSLAGCAKSSTLIPNEGVVFDIERRTTDDVMFGMFEIWRERWKGGMIINKVIIKKQT